MPNDFSSPTKVHKKQWLYMIYRNEDVLHSTKVCDMIMQEKIVI
jgi:hypothetical protein